MDERPIRRAASVVCVRADGDGEPEVLVVRRSPESRFLPGYVAFPGGAVDAGDAAHAERWFGDPALAPRAAAVRELLKRGLSAEGFKLADGDTKSSDYGVLAQGGEKGGDGADRAE